MQSLLFFILLHIHSDRICIDIRDRTIEIPSRLWNVQFHYSSSTKKNMNGIAEKKRVKISLRNITMSAKSAQREDIAEKYFFSRVSWKKKKKIKICRISDSKVVFLKNGKKNRSILLESNVYCYTVKKMFICHDDHCTRRLILIFYIGE